MIKPAPPSFADAMRVADAARMEAEKNGWAVVIVVHASGELFVDVAVFDDRHHTARYVPCLERIRNKTIEPGLEIDLVEGMGLNGGIGDDLRGRCGHCDRTPQEPGCDQCCDLHDAPALSRM